ncbi:MAG: RagB/SusD family nutrient uptake outer membrane protein, partial [Ferruginibacter sp.]
TAVSCKKDFLNQEPKGQYNEATTWKDPSLIQAFVNNIYHGIPHGFSNIMMSSLVDESVYNAQFGEQNAVKSLITPGDLIVFDLNYWTGKRQRYMSWENEFRHIRATNIFFQNIDGAPIEDAAVKSRMKGEVYFLRAHLYHNLVSIYGGVPILSKAYALTDNFDAPRDSYDNCIKFIVGQLDSAAALLPLAQTGDNLGRPTKGAALALKARVLLYAASDFYNSNGSWSGSFAQKELIGYTGGDRTARWTAAKTAAKAVIDLGVYSLYKDGAPPATADEATKNYADIFLQRSTSEDIFVRYFTPATNEDWDGYNPGLYNTPNGWHGWGSNCPTGQMADSYEMIDGIPFNWNNPVHKAAPYMNRDPRFYATINYDGVKWRARNDNAAIAKDPVGIIQTGYFLKPDGTSIGGLDTRNSILEDWNGTYTAYYLKKFLVPSIESQFVKQDLPWRYIRYTEVVMNYIEALIALGEDAEAKLWLNKIRRRVKMPDITESGTALRDRYRNERKVELAFEDHRFFDVRRWMIPDQAYTDARTVEIVYPSNASGTPVGTTVYNPTGFPSLRKPGTTVGIGQQRAWLPRFYLLPIKTDELNRNNKLVQNPLY